MSLPDLFNSGKYSCLCFIKIVKCPILWMMWIIAIIVLAFRLAKMRRNETKIDIDGTKNGNEKNKNNMIQAETTGYRRINVLVH